ncbi:hypothetical protein E7T09_18805 [Deinococcus sp. KSM4-11]|uniref:hypothetical protein n=1 Tax=Deinococcus sp. KSM4-11 TaxID=2568654 RepID=UPI0010A37DA3|nr:hypothetical protein [Deinococcus sp. KSM4-11]THF85082.1 hypothetical protein E7T09_18805 [Deinococcus sp. KSM4-11]
MSAPARPPLALVPASAAGAEPTERQEQLYAAAAAQIEATPEFATLKGATPSRAEVNVGLDETQRGYLYLRYDVPGATPQEFWAHVGRTARLNWKTGQLTVPLQSPPAPTAAGRTP